MSDETATPPAAEGQAAGRQQVQVDDTGLTSSYTNFCRVTGTPEEVILDFGLNAEPMGQNRQPIKLQQRMVCNFYTAKRLLMALTVAIQRYEQAFGVLETDVQKRVKQQGGGAAGSGGPAKLN